MKQLHKYFRPLAGLILGAGAVFSQPASAIVPVGGWGYSLGYGFDRLFGFISAEDDLWSWEVDPAAQTLISGRVSLHFDPTQFRVVAYGWQGGFGADPSLPAPPGSGPTFNPLNSDGQPWALQGPNAGLVHANVHVDNTAGSMVIEFDWGPSGYTPSSDEHFNFFGIHFAVPKGTTGFRPVPRGTGSIGLTGSPSDIASMGTTAPTYLQCSGGYCGDEPMDFVREVPEPSALTLIAAGGLALAWSIVCRKRQSIQ